MKTKQLFTDRSMFPIVGIGASAGGLEALEQFLGNVPENCGMAFVVVQHLDPTQKGLLPELLQRITQMEVFQVEERMVVNPGFVYVIPPNTSMSILQGSLHLAPPIESRGLRLPVDSFFRSLADDSRENAVGVILSGMGSDGSLGLQAIKDNKGLVVVQDPVSAKFNSMPRNAIESVDVDIVAPAGELPTLIMDYILHPPKEKSTLKSEIKDHTSYEKIILLLRKYSGNDFSSYKTNTVYRRIERRMGVHKIDKISSYASFLMENQEEVNILFKELLIGVTSFFRDPSVWEKLKESILPEIIARHPSGTKLRAWIPGCSTGEEACSLAIVFKEFIEKINPKGKFTLQIFATDLDADAIEIARKGIYPASIASDVSGDRLDRFFRSTDKCYHINTEIREMIVFAPQNIIMHPPFTKIDIVSCRNLLIYMDQELQKKILGMFFYSINPNGTLILGSSESLGSQSSLFTPIDSKLKIFRRSLTTITPELSDFPSSYTRIKPTDSKKESPALSSPSIQSLADQLLLNYYTPAGVLVNENGDIIYISGHTGKYLEPAAGKANMNIFAMLKSGLRNEFQIIFHRVILQKEDSILKNIRIDPACESERVNIFFKWIESPTPLKGTVMVIFTDVTDTVEIVIPDKNGIGKINKTRQSLLERELQHSREEIQNILEEMQSSQEELKSTNEELQSTNEELQSTNEELTTSKEEMQSMNEELQTLNAELLSKVEDYSRINNDMKNLLNSTDIATLFLDKDLNVRRYTFQTTKIIKLIKSDIGRPFTDLVTDLIYPEIAVDAQEVLKTLIFIQKQIPTLDGRWFSIRIMPYRTFEDRIDGLVITFIHISDLKRSEDNNLRTGLLNRTLMNLSSEVILILTSEKKILDMNSEAERFFGATREKAINQDFIFFLIDPAGQQTATDRINDVSSAHDEKLDYTVSLPVLSGDGSVKDVKWVIKRIPGKPSTTMAAIILTTNKHNCHE